jgi:hypothetical protein
VSVVPHGNTPSYVIPTNPDYSVDIDWAMYSPGQYDVNFRAYDGFDYTEGTLKVVDLSNSDPTAGSVAGPTPVTCTNTAAKYTCTISDCNTGQTLEVRWSVVPHGNAPSYTILPNPDKSLTVNWVGYTVGQYDINCRVNDGFANAEGTLLVVDRQNTAPVVGSVTGPTPVTCAHTADNYLCPFSDCDTSQTLTITWSMVPHGNAPVYNLPAGMDGTLTLNWASTPLGQYDVNCQVSDGITQTEGTLLVVTKNNTPPTAGAVTGPNSVTVTDVSDYSLVPPASDCDTFQTLSYTYSIVAQGNPPNYNISDADGTISVTWATYGVGIYVIGCKVSDGLVDIFAPTLQVVVSLAPCAGHAQSFTGAITIGTYSIAPMSILPRKDIAFMDSGNPGIGGLGCAQIGPSTLGIFDADTSGAHSVLFKYFLGKNDDAMSIDVSPFGGRILTVTLSEPNIVKIIDSSIVLGNPIVGTISTSDPAITWVAIDFDSNGDFWAVLRDGTAGVSYRLVHYTYLASDPYYAEDTAGVMTITPKVGVNTDIFDIAINQTARYIYILEGGANSRGNLHEYRIISGGAPQFVTTVNNLFTTALDYDSGGPTGFAGYADIDVDHMDTAQERCRILVYGRLLDLTSELIRLDQNFIVLDRETYASAFPGFAINPDVSVHNLIMPSTDSLAYWAGPVDW